MAADQDFPFTRWRQGPVLTGSVPGNPVKEAIGKLTGNVRIEAEGCGEKREATSEIEDPLRA